MNHNYDDIIHLPHPTSPTHPRMSLYDRAAQFSPFAALTGHEAAIRETARLTDTWRELSEDEAARVNEKLQWIWKNLQENFQEKQQENHEGNSGADMLVTITYFVPDEKKEGGEYRSCTGNVRQMKEFEREIIMEDGTVIPMERISEVHI